MWILTVRSPGNEPQEYLLKAGKSTVGRKSDNDIPITDESASRLHAEILYNSEANTVVIQDLSSTNGTFVNRERLLQPRTLRVNDEIRIGQHLLSLDFRNTQGKPADRLPGTQPLTRDLLLESLDYHAVLLSEAAERLNTILDLDSALKEVSSLMQRSMGADKCGVILVERFGELEQLGFPVSIARQALEQRSAIFIPDLSNPSDPDLAKSAMLLRLRSALCVPVVIGDEVAALIYVYKTRPLSRPFDRRDVQLAVAIGHQAALTIQRTRLLHNVRKEQQGRELLQRFLAPQEAENMLPNYLQTGKLPELSEKTLTLLFTDIRDSTGLAERLGARRFSEVLSRYYLEMSEVIFDHKGMLHQYIGDGLMTVFGMFSKSDPEGRAVQAALAMIERLEAVNQAAGEQIEIGIGANTGPTMAGYLEIKDRIEFTVLGDAVHIAQRLERQSRNRIFIGPDTYQAVAGRFNIQPIGSLELRGRMQSIEAYEVLPEEVKSPKSEVQPHGGASQNQESEARSQNSEEKA
jgi:adenylate cyclase